MSEGAWTTRSETGRWCRSDRYIRYRASFPSAGCSKQGERSKYLADSVTSKGTSGGGSGSSEKGCPYSSTTFSCP
eukprot:scaffold285_cov304-Pinguiococcus_pyrenoidosus.AAC.23